MTETLRPVNMASVRLHGPAEGAGAVISLMCSDDAACTGLDLAGRPDVQPFSLELLAHRLSTPARLPGTFPESQPVESGARPADAGSPVSVQRG